MTDVCLQIKIYTRQCLINSRAHYLASDKYKGHGVMLGVPVVILSAIVGTSIFGTLQSNVDIGWRIVTGLISVVATVLSSLQTFLNYANRSERHAAAAARYSAIRRALEIASIKYGSNIGGAAASGIEDLERVTKQLDAATEASPPIPDACWRTAEKEYGRAEAG